MRNVASQIFNFRTIVRLLLNSLDIALCLHPPLPPYKSTHPVHIPLLNQTTPSSNPNRAATLFIVPFCLRAPFHCGPQDNASLPPHLVCKACFCFLLQHWGLQDLGSLVITRENRLPTYYSAKICFVHFGFYAPLCCVCSISILDFQSGHQHNTLFELVSTSHFPLHGCVTEGAEMADRHVCVVNW